MLTVICVIVHKHWNVITAGEVEPKAVYYKEHTESNRKRMAYDIIYRQRLKVFLTRKISQ